MRRYFAMAALLAAVVVAGCSRRVAHAPANTALNGRLITQFGQYRAADGEVSVNISESDGKLEIGHEYNFDHVVSTNPANGQAFFPFTGSVKTTESSSGWWLVCLCGKPVAGLVL
jgi:hypothetical protein